MKRVKNAVRGVIVLAFAVALRLGFTQQEAKAYDALASGNTITMSPTEDTDLETWYQFTAPSNGSFVVSFVNTTIGGNGSGECYIYNSSNEKLDYYTSAKNWTSDTISAAAGQVYYVKVKICDYWYDNVFGLTLTFKASDVWETENNDTTAGANALTSGVVRYGTFNDNDSEDYYSFNLSNDSSVAITVGPTTVGSHSSRLLTLYSSDNVEKSLGSSSTEETYSGYLSVGTYYIKVSGSSNWGDEDIYKISYSASKYTIPKATIKKIKTGKKRKSLSGTYYRYIGKILLKGSYDVAGYTVKYSKNKKFKNAIYNSDQDLGTSTYSDTKTTIRRFTSTYEKAGKNKKKAKKYYFAVRCYVYDMFGEKMYGSWSKTKTVKL